jgi:hypothetical protein
MDMNIHPHPHTANDKRYNENENILLILIFNEKPNLVYVTMIIQLHYIALEWNIRKHIEILHSPSFLVSVLVGQGSL